MSTKPKFKLYRIIDKRTGKAFSGVVGEACFTKLGYFYRTKQTVQKWLYTLTTGKYYSFSIEVHGTIDDYIVEEYSVIECSKHATEAKDF